MKAGRNDPCPCGSDKKYKKCCMNKDEELARHAHKIEKDREIQAKAQRASDLDAHEDSDDDTNEDLEIGTKKSLKKRPSRKTRNWQSGVRASMNSKRRITRESSLYSKKP